MTAEMYGFESTPGQRDTTSNEPTLELVQDPEKEKLLKQAEETYIRFKQAFEWPDSLNDELFARVAGSEDEVSEKLSKAMEDLYIKSCGSAFVQDESRTNYKFIFEKFTIGKQSVAAVRELARQQLTVAEEIDDMYVSKRLLMTLSKMSMHQE